MLKKIISWLLFFLLFIEGIYLKVLLSRTGYGSHGTNLGCDTVFLMYSLSLTTLIITLVFFFKAKQISYVYLTCLALSSVMAITFFAMNASEVIVGIGDAIEGSWMHFFCPKT
ncbi:MAG: hypothetical protein PHR16_12890 [Methylovulum sp.]|nr:hypothetical protein [Methylovulum sp.]